MKGSPFQYVRDSYGVPAYRGARVWWLGVEGRMIHADSRIRLRFNRHDIPAGHALNRYVSHRKFTFVVTLHPCEDGIAYDREAPAKYRPSGLPYFVWSELCYGFGIYHYSDAAQSPSLRLPWPERPAVAA